MSECQVSYLKSSKTLLLKRCTQYVSKFGKLSSGHRIGKGQFSFQSQRRAMPNNVLYCTSVFISHASKVMLKILQARLQQYVNQELPDVQARLEWQRNQRSNWQYLLDYGESKGIPEKHLLLLHWLCERTDWITTNCRKFLKRWEYQLPYLTPEKTVCGSRSYS